MKKISVISLLCLYALATMGFSMKEFYCCGKLKSISLTLADDGKAECNKGDSNTDGCCKNKFQYFKVKDNHVTAAQVIMPAQFSAVLDTCFLSFQGIAFCIQETKFTHQSHAPPLYNGVPVYLSNCVFVI
ncbi:MAG: hypothetical protein ABIN92_01270 [Ferruginibacter sp.]